MPGKIKHLMWKACSNSLPTKENLVRQKILQESLCSPYNRVLEDVFHALWSYTKLHSVWASNFGWVDRSKISSGSFSELLQVIHKQPQSVALFAAIVCLIWYHINKARLDDASLPLEKITGFA